MSVAERSIQTAQPPKPRVSGMLVRQPPLVRVATMELGRWATQHGKDGRVYERRHIRIVLSDGKRIDRYATIKYERSERERLMENVMDPDKAAERGQRSADDLRRRVFDRRGHATEKVLGELQREYGSLPRAAEEQVDG